MSHFCCWWNSNHVYFLHLPLYRAPTPSLTFSFFLFLPLSSFEERPLAFPL